MDIVDYLIVGGGIAGTSIAAEVAAHGKTLLLEGETDFGYHSTGRSVAILSRCYGSGAIRALTYDSESILSNPLKPFSNNGFLNPREMLFVGGKDERDTVKEIEKQAKLEGVETQWLESAELTQIAPYLRRDAARFGLIERGGADIDVARLHHAYMKRARSLGARLLPGRRVSNIERSHDGWFVSTGEEHFSGKILINASGAWADQIAALAKIPVLGLKPLQRTVFLFPQKDLDMSLLQHMVADVSERYYFKREGGLILGSPADEKLVEPQDIQPDALDIATGVDEIERATTLRVETITHQWAGLRTFAPDRLPVVGVDPNDEKFFWFAGQGGYGIQISPALAAIGARMLTGSDSFFPVDRSTAVTGTMDPARFNI
ncbi:MAG: NAD(P)/FAD-dependent oxidoreductase [Gammaproteobacteria bacterium]